MDQEESRELGQALDLFLDEALERILFSNPVDRERIARSRLRPLLIKGSLVFQAEEQVGRQAFHRNMSKEETVSYITELLDGSFRQAEIVSGRGTGLILVSRKGKVTVKVKQKAHSGGAGDQPARIQSASGLMSHNRQKSYILKEGSPVPFLVDLGVMTKEGRIVNSRYDKYRQINRFLEFIEDILPNLNQEEETTIIDFGCGKSYLTFAMYYYLHELKGYDIRIIGLDLKREVIIHCNELAEKYGYQKLKFLVGDIADYTGVDRVDMVVTLHACDTATDFALAKAVGWNAKVILSVPCCQHELNRQIQSDVLAPVLKYGLIRERMAALVTDALRAEYLEREGYDVQILEFIDMEHTPKNILIRAVQNGRCGENQESIKKCEEFLHVSPTLKRLLDHKGEV